MNSRSPLYSNLQLYKLSQQLSTQIIPTFLSAIWPSQGQIWSTEKGAAQLPNTRYCYYYLLNNLTLGSLVIFGFDPLTANPTKWASTLKLHTDFCQQIVCV